MQPTVKKNKLYLPCSCGTHMLVVERDEELENEIKTPMWYFSFWSRGHDGEKMTWRNRIRTIWQILRKGHPYGDDLVYEKQDLTRLTRFLLTQLAPKDEDKK